MADRIKNVRELKLVAKFSDGDDRTISAPNPRTGLTKDHINGASFIKAAKASLIGDKTGANMTGWKSAAIYESTTVYLDLTT